MFEKQKDFARQHIYLTSINHTAAGFGIALILQDILVGNAFLPVAIGWVLVGFSAAVHIYEFTRS